MLRLVFGVAVFATLPATKDANGRLSVAANMCKTKPLDRPKGVALRPLVWRPAAAVAVAAAAASDDKRRRCYAAWLRAKRAEQRSDGERTLIATRNGQQRAPRPLSLLSRASRRMIVSAAATVVVASIAHRRSKLALLLATSAREHASAYFTHPSHTPLPMASSRKKE